MGTGRQRIPLIRFGGAKLLPWIAFALLGSSCELSVRGSPRDPHAPDWSPAVIHSASTTLNGTLRSCEGITRVFISEDATPPLVDAGGWQDCVTATNAIRHELSVGDGDKTLYVFATNASKKVSPPVTLTVRLDQTPPVLTLNSLDGGGAFRPGSSQSIQWTAGDANFGDAPILIESSADNGATYAQVTTAGATPGAYAWTAPATESAQYRIRLTATDRAGNQTVVVSSSPFTIDGTPPVVSAFTLNDGAASAPTHFLTAKATATDALSGVQQIRLSTSATYADDQWQAYNPAGQLVLVPRASGNATVYAWLRDAAGNVAPVQSSSIQLVIGSAPNPKILAPGGGGTYATGDPIHVDFSIASTEALAATNPIELAYTTDGGRTTTALSTTLVHGANGGCTLGAGATGCYEFNLPAPLAGGTFQLVLKATDIHGASATSLSPVLGRNGWKVIAGRDRSLMGQAAVATAFNDLVGYMAIDSRGNLYSSATAKIYKFDARTGAVSRLVGDGTAATTGDGGLPANARIGFSNSAVAVDRNDLIYWADTNGVRRINASGNVETYLGGGTTVSPSTGMARTALSTSAGGNTSRINSIVFDSQNRMIFGYYARIAGVNTGLVIRVNADDKLEILAGNYTTAAIGPDGSDATTSGLGTGCSTNWSPSIAIKRGSPDMIYGIFCNSVIYSLNTANKQISYLANWGTNVYQLAYDTYRDRLVVASPFQAVRFYRVDAVNSSTAVTTSESSGSTGLTVDGAGGVYFNSNVGQRLWYISPTNALSQFAGAASNTGDGGPAIGADFRSLGKLVTLTNGDILVEDTGNQRIRRLSGGNVSFVRNMSIGSNWTGLMAATAAGANALYTEWYNTLNIQDAVASVCRYLCAGSGTNIADATDGSAASTLVRSSMVALAFDPVRNSNFVWFRSATVSAINEIDSGGITYRRVNSGNVAPATPSGTTIASSLDASSPAVASRLQAYNGVIYAQMTSNLVYRLPIGGSVATEVSVAASSFVVDGANNVLYYTVGTGLYKKTLGTGTTGTLIATLPLAALLQAKSPAANSLLFTLGDFAYQYTDATNIP